MGILGVFKKIGGGIKWFGKKTGKGALYVVGRPEVRLVTKFLPVPYLNTAVEIVNGLQDKAVPGTERMRAAIALLREDPHFAGLKESELRWILETALQVAEGRIEFNESHYGDHA